MGADFVAARCRLVATEDEARSRLASMDNITFLARYSEYNDSDAEDALDDERNIDPDGIALLRKIASDAITECYHGSRDTVVWDFDGVLWAISGGLSWGDAPSDGFDAVYLLSCLEVTL